MRASPGSSISRRIFPGTPATSDRGGMTAPSGTTAPAAMRLPAPMRAPLSTMAPIPTRQSSSTVQPWRTARWPTDTPAPMLVGCPASVCTTTPSCRLLPSPSTIGSKSARSTAVYQTLEPARRSTAPTRSALGATQAVSWTTGVTPSSLTITSVHRDAVDAVDAGDPVGGVQLGRGHLAPDPRHEREEHPGDDERDDTVDEVVDRVAEAAHRLDELRGDGLARGAAEEPERHGLAREGA